MKLPAHRSVHLRIALAVVLLACAPDGSTLASRSDSAITASRAGAPGEHRQYGVPVKLGDGHVRTYVVLDAKDDHRPLEVGVAIDARTIEGTLPTGEPLYIPLALPARTPAPFRFVLFDWNPHGHMPPGVFDLPHFDFHFYTVPQGDVEAINVADPDFATKADNLPTGDYLPPAYAVGKPPSAAPSSVAMPGMGVHWQDLLSPEYQRVLGRPEAYRPFTKTYVYVTWDGRITALEPMITREYLLRRVDEHVPIRQPARYPDPGWYPSAYSIQYDGHAREYRVALVDFTWRP